MEISSQPMISVVICCHNPRMDYLQKVLDSLENQTLEKTEWELILVDNASNQDLSQVVNLTWHPRGRHIRELRIGTLFARLRGMKEFSGKLLAFVDDDNVLNSDYLQQAISIATNYPFLGAIGSGFISPAFEVCPSPRINKHLWMLALRDFPNELWGNRPDFFTTPCTAGLVLRREVTSACIKVFESCQLRTCLGQSGENLVRGEDDEIVWIGCEAGFGCGLFPSLRMTHLIPSNRIEIDYLVKLKEGHAFSALILDYLHGKRISRPELKLPSFSSAFGKVVRGNISAFLNELRVAWLWFRSNHEDRAIAEADLRGKKRAWKHLKSFNADKVSMGPINFEN